ncbi:MAG: molybdopterin-dependent oxidoreductase [Candidatus Lokiarchaeota archaeon]|nr:molybdopterin-dependent oxidoreductase [Candidatus Lokiarchaeota archaeon]MBD3338880.1 molybdopterin-dependent oxidoreductase [Candidatus Lokiarchaeota archaeon]
METRNFTILIVSICIGLTVFWLTAYNVVRLGIDPIAYIEANTSEVFLEGESEDEQTVVIIRGNIKEELRLSISDLKSDEYKQVTDDFDFKNSYGTEWTDEYTGTTLWSILEEEGILESDASTFLFVGQDGYESPEPLSIEDIAKQHENDVILAYKIEGERLSNDIGPVRSVIDRDVIEHLEPDHWNSQFAVKSVKYVEIQ